MRRLFENLWRRPIKQQLNLIYIPVILISAILIGIFSYLFQIKQIEKNSSFLLENSVNQTAISVNEKINIPFSQMVAESDSVSVGNLFMNRYTEEDKSRKYMDILDCYNQMESVYYSINDIIDSIYFVTNTGVEVSMYKGDTPVNIGIDFNEWFNRDIYSETGYGWIESHEDKVFSSKSSRNVISIVKKFGTKDSKNKAILIYNLKTEYFKELLDKVNISPNGYVVVMSPDGKAIVNSTIKTFNIEDNDIARIKSDIEKGSINDTKIGKEKVSIYSSSEDNLWKVIGVVPKKDLVSEANNLKVILIAFIGILSIVLLYISTLLARGVSKPIEILSNKVKEFEFGNINVKFEIDTENELGTLSKGLERFKESVLELLKKVMQEEKQKSKLELLIMQSQIKPHFLYNTLGSIKHLIDMGRNDKASEMCAALSKFYMIGLSGGRDIIYVSEEIEHIRNYLKIQQMRYDKEFEFYINISEDIMNEKMLILTLQPIIENAIYHGIKGKEGLGTIILSGNKKDDKMIFEIYDDGLGMSEQELDNLIKTINNRNDQQLKSFGLRNVNNRLKLYFGSKARMNFFSIKNEFTQVIIEIPIEAGQKGEEKYV
ncbi:sensor histidine kinase [Clostridium beijerinckii]|uniref:Two-component system sensor histidine kinase YesM n=1 Tax=Clostridium beijerinckii TaxID=1520 RepID=A0AAE5LSJ2_CLOBE|nr:sensor histidine kinase [Clostridium beijerinckii]NSB16821.1 two-component system sensor histidine kinase YesM [Clostridium beijerinckii]OOM31428.1 putative sensor-like histidine kinase [Clostridium beijerinckii]